MTNEYGPYSHPWEDGSCSFIDWSTRMADQMHGLTPAHIEAMDHLDSEQRAFLLLRLAAVQRRIEVGTSFPGVFLGRSHASVGNH